MLNKNDFQNAIRELQYTPSVDLFASRINTQLKSFFSYRPDPKSEAVDAFTTDWAGIQFYAFPPFSIIPRVIQKIWNDKARGIIIIPDWPNQSWYGQVSELPIKHIILYPRPDLLLLPNNEMKHPLHKTLQLKAVLVSGK